MTTTASDEEIVRAYIEGAVNAQALRPNRTEAFLAFIRLTATVARLEAENERLRDAVAYSMIAIDDWLHVYAEEECGEEYVAATKKRLSEHGVLYYIAITQKRNRAALARNGEKGNG